jgi:2-keto-4-pentenoate hydratase
VRHLAALRAQLARRRALLDAGARHVGWKVGGDIEEVGDPVFGYLTSATLIAPGAPCDVSGARALRAETELLLEVLPGDDVRYGVALELVDVARPPHDPAEIIAGNVFHLAAALGAERASAPGGEARMWVDGSLAEAQPVTTDVPAVLARLRSQLTAAGEQLRPGDLILSGSLCHVPVAPGARLAAEIDGLGRIEART